MNPGYTLRLWTDANNERFIAQHYPWFLRYFRQYDKMIKRADAVRPFYLYHFGGVYADLDFACIRPFDALLQRHASSQVLLGPAMLTKVARTEGPASGVTVLNSSHFYSISWNLRDWARVERGDRVNMTAMRAVFTKAAAIDPSIYAVTSWMHSWDWRWLPYELRTEKCARQAFKANCAMSSDHSASLLKTEAELTSSFDELARLLEQSDGGDAFKRTRAAWYEAGGLAEFVRAHAELAAYLPAIEREVAEVREEWEQVQPARKELARQKQRVAHLQGQMYARLELGFTLPANLGDVLAEQQATWQREESMTSQQLAQHVETLAARRAHMEQSHREQGWRKGAERFGEVMGLSSEALLTVRLAILEADATQLRLRAKATMRAMHELMSQHEQVHAELHELTGQLELLTGIRELPCSETQLLADEYEAAVEAEVLRGTLSTLRPRVAEAAHLRLAWHAKAGACKAGEALHAPNLPALHTALVDAKRLADAAEPIRRQELVLRAKLAKLHGRLQALGQLRTLAAAGTDSATLASEAERLASAARLQQLRLSMRATDLRLLHMRHERAEANLHAAGGAIVCLKKLRFSLHNAPAVTHEGGRA
ncbi:glycosyltransferase family 32 protein, partial [Chrysochromulina tobinii]